MNGPNSAAARNCKIRRLNFHFIIQLLIVAALAHPLCAQTFWAADFSAQNGAATGSNWNASYSGEGTFNTVAGQYFEAMGMSGEGVFLSSVIDISATGYARIHFSMLFQQMDPSDYFNIYYRVNGGAETLYANVFPNIGNASNVTGPIIVGTQVQIVIRIRSITQAMFQISQLSVLSGQSIYSRQTGSWGDPNSWSINGYTGAACNCFPGAGQVVMIGNNFTISLISNQSPDALIIENSGNLQFNSSSTEPTLTITGGLLWVKNGGAIIHNPTDKGKLQFASNALVPTLENQFIIDGIVWANDVEVGTSLEISGTGSAMIVNTFNLNASGIIVTNDLTGPLAGGYGIMFKPGTRGAQLVNHGTVDARNILFGDSGNLVNNSGTLLLLTDIQIYSSGIDNSQVNNYAQGTLIFSSIRGNYLTPNTGSGGNLQLNNSGLIRQTGYFVDIPPTSVVTNSFNNLPGGTWNLISGITDNDPDVRLFCGTGTNTFNYGGTGSFQKIIQPQDAYSNLIMSGSGIKICMGSFSVNGNVTVQSGASVTTLNLMNFTISTGGNWALQGPNSGISGTSSTVMFNGMTDQTISSSSALNPTFGSLTMDKTGGNLILMHNVTINNVLTLYNGNLVLNGNELDIFNTTSASIVGYPQYRGVIISENINSKVKLLTGAGNGVFTIPFAVSNTSNFIPVVITKTGGISSTGEIRIASSRYNVNDFATWPTGVINLNDLTGASLTSMIVSRYWYMAYFNYSNDFTASVNISALISEFPSLASFGVRSWNLSGWNNPSPFNNRGFSNLGNPNAVGSINLLSLTNNPIWTMTADQSLSIEWLSFQLKSGEGHIDLNWTTASEMNNDYFMVEKSTDGVIFGPLQKIDGHGTSNEEHHYTYRDERPHLGKSYYRIRQTDFDGGSSYSIIQIADYNKSIADFGLFPNPCMNGKLDMKITPPPIEATQLLIWDMNGSKVFEQEQVSDPDGWVKGLEVGGIPSGTYIMEIRTSPPQRKILIIE